MPGCAGSVGQGQDLLDEGVGEFLGLFEEGEVAGVFEPDEVFVGVVHFVEEILGDNGRGVGIVAAFEEENGDVVVVA